MNKHILRILVQAPFWHLICIKNFQWYILCTFCCYYGLIYIKFGADLKSKFKKIYAETVSSNGAI